MDTLTAEERVAASLLIEQIMERYDKIVENHARHAKLVCGDSSVDIEDIKQDIYFYIMQFSLKKFMSTQDWLPNIKMMSRNACSNFLQKVKSKKRRTNQYTIAEEICESSLGFCDSPESYLEFVESIDYLPALRRDILNYLTEPTDQPDRFSIDKLAKYFNLTQTAARREYLALRESFNY